jgi:hypothetical protein
MSGCDQVWFASRCPWSRIARTVAGRTLSLTPTLKNVAITPWSRRIRRMASVLAPGPSSKVRATVRPLPGAVRLIP